MLQKTTFRLAGFLLCCLAALIPEPTFGQPTVLSIDRRAGPARLWLEGETGRDYLIESSDGDLTPNSWQLLLTTPLLSGPQPWFDANSLLTPKRFYRAVKLEPADPVSAPNFRLTDHLGRSRELDYYLNNPNVKVMVLIFTANGCAEMPYMLPVLGGLTNRFAAPSVLFWMIDSNAGDNRSNILAEATALGITIPILHDRAQLVARSYQAVTSPEVLALHKVFFPSESAVKWSVFYRGAIDDRVGSSPVATTQYYLSNALVNVLAGQPVAPTRSRAAGCDITLNPRYPNLSYSADIAPLLQNKCVKCHSDGNIAPFTMSDYTVVQTWAPTMRDEVLSGRMPPWQADYNYGVFTNDSSLTPEEAAKLIQWIDDGAPRGTGPDPLVNVSVPTDYPYAWPTELGQPTAVLSIPPQSIPAVGVVDYRYFNVTNTFTTDVWLRAAIVKPGNLKVVHHSLVFSGSSGSLQGLDGFFAHYVPGYEGVAFPPGTGKLLRRGEVLRFQMHYISIGTSQSDQTQLGLYVMPAPPARSLLTKSTYNIFFRIPPGNPDYQTNATFTLPKAGYLYEFSPHMHLRGARFKYEAIYPDNMREVLCSVPDYVFHWQRLYRLAEPKFLPAGTVISCTGAWDNSPQNLENPDPTATVRFGEQTFDEMFIGYFNYAEVP